MTATEKRKQQKLLWKAGSLVETAMLALGTDGLIEQPGMVSVQKSLSMAMAKLNKLNIRITCYLDPEPEE